MTTTAMTMAGMTMAGTAVRTSTVILMLTGTLMRSAPTG